MPRARDASPDVPPRSTHRALPGLALLLACTSHPPHPDEPFPDEHLLRYSLSPFALRHDTAITIRHTEREGDADHYDISGILEIDPVGEHLEVRHATRSVQFTDLGLGYTTLFGALVFTGDTYEPPQRISGVETIDTRGALTQIPTRPNTTATEDDPRVAQLRALMGLPELPELPLTLGVPRTVTTYGPNEHVTVPVLEIQTTYLLRSIDHRAGRPIAVIDIHATATGARVLAVWQTHVSESADLTSEARLEFDLGARHPVRWTAKASHSSVEFTGWPPAPFLHRSLEISLESTYTPA